MKVAGSSGRSGDFGPDVSTQNEMGILESGVNDLCAATWNVEWAKPASRRLRAMLEALDSIEPAILCLTESYLGSLDSGWHVIDSDPDYGYRQVEGRRKVVLASRTPWQDVDRLGVAALPGGRFLSGKTVIGDVAVRVIGLCVPWSHAHVATGRKDRKPWEDHLTFLAGLAEYLAALPDNTPTMILGDLNQRIPRRRAPLYAFDALQAALLDRFQPATASEAGQDGAQPVDHILHSDHLFVSTRWQFPKVGKSGLRLSDHDGVAAALRFHQS